MRVPVAALPAHVAEQTAEGAEVGVQFEEEFQVTAVADHSSTLLAQGIPLSADSPQYLYTQLPALRPQLLAEATKDAQNRARVIVKATGAHLGSLRGVDVGVFQVTAPNSTQVEDYGVYDTSTVEKDVTAVVNITFGVG